MAENLVWIDMEMTGLDPERGAILEIATIVTDSELNIIAEGPNIAINHPESILNAMNGWSAEHHKGSGLLSRVRASSCNNDEAERATQEFLALHCKRGKSPLCGNTIWQDRRFLVKHMPTLEAFLHYRIIDVSSLKELVKRWYPSLPEYEKRKDHLALSDIRESIAELKYYRKRCFAMIFEFEEIIHSNNFFAIKIGTLLVDQ